MDELEKAHELIQTLGGVLRGALPYLERARQQADYEVAPLSEAKKALSQLD